MGNQSFEAMERFVKLTAGSCSAMMLVPDLMSWLLPRRSCWQEGDLFMFCCHIVILLVVFNIMGMCMRLPHRICTSQ